MMGPMNTPDQTALPLEYAAELAFELHLLRGECSDAAQRMVTAQRLDVLALEDCAVLDEALNRAQKIVQSAVNRIRNAQASRNSSPGC